MQDILSSGTSSTLSFQTDQMNINLSEPEKELLRWHQRFGHVFIQRIQWMMRNGLLATTDRAKRLHAEQLSW